jgi:hypothetical protein
VPATREEKNYTSWQEGARKDVERAFGVLKNTWQFLDRPILLHDLTDISNRVVTCLLLHNIVVTDRIMQETTSVRDMILQWVLLIRLMLKCSNRQIFKSCKMLLQEKEEQSLESTMPLLQFRQL